MFLTFAIVCSVAIIGALVTPLLLIGRDDLFISDVRFSEAQVKLLEEFIKNENISENTSWQSRRKKIIQQFNQLS